MEDKENVMAAFTKDRLKKIVLLIIVASFVYPIIHATIYAIPYSDDFSKMVTYKSYDCGFWEYLFLNVVDFYKNWQGTYFAALIGGIPTYYFGGILALRLEMFGNTVLFFVALYFSVQSVLTYFGINREKRRLAELLYVVTGLFFLLNQTRLEEVFYWHSGMASYTLPLSCTLVSIICYLNYEVSKYKKSWLLMGIITAVCAAGGALNVSAFLCAALLFFIGYNFVIHKKNDRNIIIGIVAFAGSLLNAAAPGNFVRHSLVDSEIRLGGTLFATAVRVSDTIADSMQNGLLLPVVIVVFLTSYNYLKQSEFAFRYPGFVSIYGLFAIYVTDFPVLLGYSFRLMPERCVFVEQLAIVLWFIIVSIYWGGWASQKECFSFSKEWYIVIVLVCILPLSSYFSITRLMEFTPYKIVTNIKNGNFNTVTSRQEDVIRQIESSVEKDVIVYEYVGEESEWTIINPIGITEDENHWINLAVADYYDKDSVVVQYITE